MIAMKHLSVIFILIFAVCCCGGALPAAAQEKPGLSEKDLEKHVYYFEVSDGKITGDGARFLIDEINQSQFVLLGEYHNSLRISEFTRAVVPIFHDAGCRTFALEVGPISAEILAEMSKDAARTGENLKAFNSRFHVVEGNRVLTPIPFFGNVEDAEFLAAARIRNWNLLGLDQEFSFGYLPLIERMYENLKPKKKRELKTLFEQVNISIKAFYEADVKGEKSLYKAILDSKKVNEFLDAAAKDNPKNKRIAEAVRFTTEIYYLNDAQVRKYYEANSRRINYMKRNLAEGLARLKFDFAKDKMLLKMGAVHTGRGFSDLSLFEIGNTLSELAEFNGNRSLHVEFGSRYYVDNNGREIDALDDKNGFLYRYQALLQMGRKDRWTLIDLRPLREKVFYGRRFKLDPIVLEIFKNQDFYVIAPVEKAPSPNYISAG
jgi:hypothetical protein